MFKFLILHLGLAFNNYEFIKNCNDNDENGMYVVNIKIHIESPALLILNKRHGSTQDMTSNEFSGVVKFFQKIFEEANNELRKYGAQLRGDYSSLNLDRFPKPWSKRKCAGMSPIDSRIFAVKDMFEKTKNRGTNNRILILYCENELHPFASNVSNINLNGCESMSTVLFTNDEKLKKQVFEELMRIVGQTKYIIHNKVSPFYNFKVCRFLKRCITSLEFQVGQYITEPVIYKDVLPDINTSNVAI